MRLPRGLWAIALCGALAGCAPGTGTPAATAGPSHAAQKADVHAIEADLEAEIDRKLGVVGTVVTCPSQISWHVGDSIHCDISTPDVAAGLGVVTLEDEDGRYSWYMTNTCSAERDILGTPMAGCVSPRPSDITTCPWEDGELQCPTPTSSPRARVGPQGIEP